jgi:hypothetical protein
MPGNLFRQHVPRASMDDQVYERQNDCGSDTYDGRVNGQSEDSAYKEEHAKHGKVHGFIYFKNEIAHDEGNSANDKAPVHPNSHRPDHPTGK